jgi:hypothetical protein
MIDLAQGNIIGKRKITRGEMTIGENTNDG